MFAATALGFSNDEATILHAPAEGPEAALATLRSYGSGMPASDIRSLLVYHIQAALDLGIPDHARRLFAALNEHLELYPELLPEADHAIATEAAKGADGAASSDIQTTQPQAASTALIQTGLMRAAGVV